MTCTLLKAQIYNFPKAISKFRDSICLLKCFAVICFFLSEVIRKDVSASSLFEVKRKESFKYFFLKCEFDVLAAEIPSAVHLPDHSAFLKMIAMLLS